MFFFRRPTDSFKALEVTQSIHYARPFLINLLTHVGRQAFVLVVRRSRHIECASM